jgi:hypothetical protein
METGLRPAQRVRAKARKRRVIARLRKWGLVPKR